MHITLQLKLGKQLDSEDLYQAAGLPALIFPDLDYSIDLEVCYDLDQT